VSEIDYYFLKVVLIEKPGLFGRSLLRELAGLSISEQAQHSGTSAYRCTGEGVFGLAAVEDSDGRCARWRMIGSTLDWSNIRGSNLFGMAGS
jgi:hypothetical protein